MIVVTHVDNKVTGVYSVANSDLSSLNLTSVEYMTFESSGAYKGMDIRALNVDGTRKSLEEQYALGIISLQENEHIVNGEIVKLTETQKIVDNEIVELTELELWQKDPDTYRHPDIAHFDQQISELRAREEDMIQAKLREMAIRELEAEANNEPL